MKMPFELVSKISLPKIEYPNPSQNLAPANKLVQKSDFSFENAPEEQATMKMRKKILSLP